MDVMEENFSSLEMQLILKYTKEILEEILGMIKWLPLSQGIEETFLDRNVKEC